MEAPEKEWIRNVFRLRGLPADSSKAPVHVARLLSGLLGDVKESDIEVASIATTIGFERLRTRTATLKFRAISSVFRGRLEGDEWDFQQRLSDSTWHFKPGLEFDEWKPPSRDQLRHLVLDCHFRGLTPLNEVEPSFHASE